MDENLHKGHRKRLKKELITEKFPEGIADHRILENLLFYGIPRKDTNPIAHDLLNTFGSFHAVFEAEAEDLLQIKGMTENSVALIKLILPILRRYEDKKIDDKKVFESIEEIGEYLVKRHLGYREEVFIATTFTAEGTKISSEIVTKGDVNTVSVAMKSIVRISLRDNASSIVLSHNHVVGTALPSKEDIDATIQINKILSSIGVRLLDHIIVAGNDFISLRQSKEYNSIFIINDTK